MDRKGVDVVPDPLTENALEVAEVRDYRVRVRQTCGDELSLRTCIEPVDDSCRGVANEGLNRTASIEELKAGLIQDLPVVNLGPEGDHQANRFTEIFRFPRGS